MCPRSRGLPSREGKRKGRVDELILLLSDAQIDSAGKRLDRDRAAGAAIGERTASGWQRALDHIPRIGIVAVDDIRSLHGRIAVGEGVADHHPHARWRLDTYRLAVIAGQTHVGDARKRREIAHACLQRLVRRHGNVRLRCRVKRVEGIQRTGEHSSRWTGNQVRAWLEKDRRRLGRKWWSSQRQNHHHHHQETTDKNATPHRFTPPATLSPNATLAMLAMTRTRAEHGFAPEAVYANDRLCALR